jgi:hypothetical protein
VSKGPGAMALTRMPCWPRAAAAEDPLPLPDLELADGVERADAGVVHEHVEPAELRDRALHDRRDVVEVPHVGGESDGVAAQGAEVLGGVLAVLVVPAHDGDAGAGGDVALGDGAPDAAGAAGDDGDAAGHVEEVAELCAVHAGLRGSGLRDQGRTSGSRSQPRMVEVEAISMFS